MRKVKQVKKENEVKQYIKNGYYVVDLEDKYGKMHRGLRVDKLVFETYVRPLRADEDVIHLDGNKLNNYVENLKAVRK